MEQCFLFDLGYNEERKQFIKVKFLVYFDKIKIYYLYSKTDDFAEFGYFSPTITYDVKDFFINKRKAKGIFEDIDLKEFDDISEIKTTRINFVIPDSIYDHIFKNLDKLIIEKIKETYLSPLDEKYFQNNGALLISYNNIIKDIKNDNAFKKMLLLDIYPVSYYRSFINEYFPKSINNEKYTYDLKINSELNDKFTGKTFNECFGMCDCEEDVINLAKNIYYFADLKYLNNKDFYVNNIKKQNNFLQTIMIFIYQKQLKRDIQTIIDYMNIANTIYSGQIYNDFTKEIIKYYSEYGDNNLLVYLYRKTYANKTYFNLDSFLYNLEGIIKLIECIDGADNFYKHQAKYLEDKNKEAENQIQEQNKKYKKLEKKLKDKEKHFNILGVLSAGAVGTVTIAAVLFNKFKKKK